LFEFTLGLVEHHVKKKSCHVHENTLIQNEGYDMFLNEIGCEDEIMEETQENQSL
jgi:hypothetical protein